MFPSPDLPRRLRIAVVGAGEITQTVHLPNLEQLGDLFELVAIADPSDRACDFLRRRYRLEGSYSDARAVLGHPHLDAIAVCSPSATHADITIDALSAGLHVLVEKPLCITLSDADRIIAARDRAERVVQVAYMNRYDIAYERMVDDLPPSVDDVRAINVVTYDPQLGRLFARRDRVFATDVPRAARDDVDRKLERQVEEALGHSSPEVNYAFVEIFLGTLTHDVNLVHGLLDAMGERTPCQVVDAASWAAGKGATASLQLSSGARWNTTFVELSRVHDFRMRIELFRDDAVQALSFPSPYLANAPSRYERNAERAGVREITRVGSFNECFLRELECFHASVTARDPCRTPPEQARVDVDALTQMYRCLDIANSPVFASPDT